LNWKFDNSIDFTYNPIRWSVCLYNNRKTFGSIHNFKYISCVWACDKNWFPYTGQKWWLWRGLFSIILNNIACPQWCFVVGFDQLQHHHHEEHGTKQLHRVPHACRSCTVDMSVWLTDVSYPYVAGKQNNPRPSRKGHPIHLIQFPTTQTLLTRSAQSNCSHSVPLSGRILPVLDLFKVYVRTRELFWIGPRIILCPIAERNCIQQNNDKTISYWVQRNHHSFFTTLWHALEERK